MSGSGKQSGEQHPIGNITTVPGCQHAATPGYPKATTPKNNSNSQPVTHKSNTYDKHGSSKETYTEGHYEHDKATFKYGDKTVTTEHETRDYLQVHYGGGSDRKGGSGGSKKSLE